MSQVERQERRARGETFYEAQRRHRRAGWRFTALALVGLAVTSLPVAVAFSPPIAAVVLIAVDLLRTVLPLPDLVADVVDLFGHVTPGSGFVDPAQPLTVGLVVTVAALAVLPGMVVVLCAWVLVRRLLLRAGPEAVVLATGARPPDPTDHEERQLVNLVEEIAIAAGIPPPRVRVLEGKAVNAAVVGRSVDDAIVVVPRTLLDQLGRPATGAIVANLVAMAVNGDLRIAQSMAATTQTVDVLGTVLAAPTSARARRLLRTLLQLMRQPVDAPGTAGDGPTEAGGTDGERPPEVQMVLDELIAVGNLEDVDPDRTSGWQALTFPLLIARVALSLTQLSVLGLVISPVMALRWRRRRLLADATTVELTRDPDALVTALEHLEARGTSVPAGPWSHLFVVGPEIERDRSQRRFEQRLAAAGEAQGPDGESGWAATRRRRRARRAANAELQRELGTSMQTSRPRMGSGSDVVTFLPPVEQRIQRLVALGGTRTTTPYRRPPVHELSGLGRFVYVLIAVAVPLFVVSGVLFIACSLAMASIAAALELVVVAPLVALVHVVVA
jgi:Zn-dependent protease with chaperone function